MDFELPGQLSGPECRRVISQAIALRRTLSPWFDLIRHESIRKLTLVLRVDGSLGSFGSPGVENVMVDAGVLSCDVVIADHGWKELSDEQIAGVLRQQIAIAVEACFGQQRVAYFADDLVQAMTRSTS